MEQVAAFIDRGVEEAAAKDGEPDQSFCDRMRAEIREFLAPFPAPGLGVA